MTESAPATDREMQEEFRQKRIAACKRLFAAYAVVDEGRTNPWVHQYCEARLVISEDVFAEAIHQMWDDSRFTYSVRGLFDLNKGAELTPEEQQTAVFVKTVVEFTKARDAACQPLAEALISNY